jgi:hypothetical protein
MPSTRSIVLRTNQAALRAFHAALRPYHTHHNIKNSGRLPTLWQAIKAVLPQLDTSALFQIAITPHVGMTCREALRRLNTIELRRQRQNWRERVRAAQAAFGLDGRRALLNCYREVSR